MIGPRRARLYLRAVGEVRRAARDVYHAPWPRLYVRALRLRRDGFALDESLHTGLLDPRVRPDPHAVSRRTRLAAQETLNAAPLRPLVDDKLLFHRYASQRGLPVPELYATVARAATGWNWRTGRAVPAAGWPDAFAGLPVEVVVKPVDGYRGDGVRQLARAQDGWRDTAGRLTNPARVGAQALADGRHDAWLVQERLHNHPTLARLGRGAALQTVRLVMHVDPDGAIHHTMGMLTIRAGSARVGDIGHGSPSNLMCRLDDRGMVVEAFRAGPGGLGVARTAVDPATGRTVTGTRIPMWDEVRALGVRTAEAFLPMRSLGLDIAVTPRGPVLVDANCWWDVHPGEPMRAIMAGLTGAPA